jgi:protein TonB
MAMDLRAGIACAIAAHAGVIMFGGLLFGTGPTDHATLQQVQLLSEKELAAEQEQPKPESERTEREAEELEREATEVPDAEEVVRNLELSAAANAPELQAASLGAIEAALSGQGGAGGDFAQALDFSSGGRIGGTGKAGALDERLESVFSLAEIDQKPRVIFQNTPVYPTSMRGKKVEGLVTVVFIVDQSGKVLKPRVEKASHPAFEKPAIDAVKQWKFEPAVKGGQRVSCKMRAPIRFQAG